MNWQDSYNRWNQFDALEPNLKQNLVEIKEDTNRLEDAFYQTLAFGTGGMRGILGAGTNRMNIYTVRKAAKGIATYLESKGQAWKKRGVVVAYDCRHMSEEFALETAKALGVHDIPTYVFTSLRPTPELSFAVRHLGSAVGVMITASHNPPEYNGYKVYNETGGQMPPEQADLLIGYVNEVEDELQVEVLKEEALQEKGLLTWIDESVDEAYLEAIKKVTLQSNIIASESDFQIVFSPLHGTAEGLTQKALKQAGFKHVHTVEVQANADPEFSTVESPNPEEHQAFELVMDKGEATSADVLIATDPDADRLGVAAINTKGDYQVLTGNQLGALLLDYLLTHRESVPVNGMMIKTIVTSELGKAIAEYHGIKSMDVLTGFKYISEKIESFEQTGEHTFLFGYEESYGFLIEPFSRDKDAIQATVLACEMGAYWKSEGKTLFEALDALFDQHGVYLEDLHSMKLEGLDGAKQIQNIMEDFRCKPVNNVKGLKLEAVEDYLIGKRTWMQSGESEEIGLPSANVVKFKLSDDCWCCLRPSGTEPKIKFYFGVRGDDRKQAEERLEKLKSSVLERL
ncbi:phospho-sugar mutase [Halalkalibacillus halophilus]|uniref:phospho-sugar mutase n=1 Tax=Halalkalibacillus halophilus TaxID=392827 RepID=UPI00041CC29F|nr:phospho-sugar mutase [Halalkalibacillus halophilus]